MKKCILLVRVSTIMQDLVQQTEKVRDAAIRDGYKEENIIIIEDKESAVKLSEEERNGLNNMKRAIESDSDIDCVYTYEISRLSRQAKMVFSIRDWLIEHKVQLVVLNPYFKMLKDDGTLSETSNIFFGIFASMAENEGYIRKARLLRGQIKSKASGKVGTGKPMFGYKALKDGTVAINDDEAKIVRDIYKMYINGMSVGSIADELTSTGTLVYDSKNASTAFVRRILVQKRYAGLKEDAYELVYPKIISEEVYNKSMDIHKKLNKKNPIRKTKKNPLLQGIIKNKQGYSLSYGGQYYLQTNSEKGDVVNILSETVESIVKKSVSVYINETTNIDDKIKMFNSKLDKLNLMLVECRRKSKVVADENDRINERIIKGRMNEARGDAMIDSNNKLIVELSERESEIIFEIGEVESKIVELGSFMHDESNNVEPTREVILNSVSKIVCSVVRKCTKRIDIEFKCGKVDSWIYGFGSRTITHLTECV